MLTFYYFFPSGSEAAIGRGASRGRQERQSTILRTRPESLDSKQGSSGDAVQIVSNFFALKTPKDWKLYQYRYVLILALLNVSCSVYLSS